MSYQPRLLERFGSIDGLTSYTFPITEFEHESAQPLRVPLTPLAGAHYAYDHRGASPGLKDPARETLRVMISELTGPAAVDAEYDEMKTKCQGIGLGKLYTVDSANVRRWAYARLGAMPSTTWRAGMIHQLAVSMNFIRLSDWFGEEEMVYQFDLGHNGNTYYINNPGTSDVYDIEFRLRARANVTHFGGDLISDRTRSLNTEGDGLVLYRSLAGLWRANTNRVTNGGFETNSTGWTASGTSTIARELSNAAGVASKFGAAHARCTRGDNAICGSFAITLPGAGVYWITGWVWVASSASGVVSLNMENFAGSSGTATANDVAGSRNDWQRIVVGPFTAAGGDLVGNVVWRYTGTTGEAFLVDGIQVEQSAIPSPYKHTDGGTASRVGASVAVLQGTHALGLSSATGWAAFRVVNRLPTGTNSDTARPLFDWRVDANNRITLSWITSGNWRIERLSAAAGASESVVDAAMTKDEMLTIVAAWSATHVRLSLNGAAFEQTANTVAPALSATDIIIGAILTEYWDSDIKWCAFGNGALTDADAAAIHALDTSAHDIGPQPAMTDFPVTPLVQWSADDGGSGTTYYTNPSFANQTLGLVGFSTTRDGTAVGHEWKHDTGDKSVVYSTDEGVTYVNDLTNFSRNAQGLMRLQPGLNLMAHGDGGAAINAVLEVRFHAAYE